MIYLGLENARVRYDNYITLEVAALTLQKSLSALYIWRGKQISV